MYGHNSDVPVETRQRRRDRITFSRDQLNVLEALFKVSSHPDELTRFNVAKTIDVSEVRVQVWFKNRRVRWRNETKSKETGIIGGKISKKRRPILSSTNNSANVLRRKDVGYAAALSLSANGCGDVTVQPMTYCWSPNSACQGYSNSYYSASVNDRYLNTPNSNTMLYVETSRNGYQVNYLSDNQYPVMFQQQHNDEAYMYSSARGHERFRSPVRELTENDLDMISYSDLLKIHEC
ncbi:hypothetical protein DPMN_064467 [Dreissena polymorpha]|uniref:Homeobox domain-containing protein n=1 Tax=Dreissena polymorpha TaxID=45954 RepID=A0A9D4CCA3_DREPO|nr:hypothetical protein DPMN_064467 [Dreissena polymorpha]